MTFLYLKPIFISPISFFNWIKELPLKTSEEHSCKFKIDKKPIQSDTPKQRITLPKISLQCIRTLAKLQFNCFAISQKRNLFTEKLLINGCLRLHMFAKRFHIPKIYTFIFLLKMVYEYLLQSCGHVDVNI